MEQAGFTKDGKKIPDYIFQRNAECEGGNVAWAEYLSKEVPGGLTKAQKKESQGREVIVRFHIEKDGSLTDIAILKSGGLDWLDEYSTNIIRRCNLQWHPAIYNNKSVSSTRECTLTYPAGVIRIQHH